MDEYTQLNLVECAIRGCFVEEQSGLRASGHGNHPRGLCAQMM